MPSNLYLLCCSATLAAADQSPPEIRVSRLFILIKLTGSRDQLSPNIVVQFLKYTCAEPSPRLSEWPLSDLMRSLHLLPTQPKVASWKVPKNKVVPISVQYHEPWIPGKTTYLQFNHTSTYEPYNVLKKKCTNPLFVTLYNYAPKTSINQWWLYCIVH